MSITSALKKLAKNVFNVNTTGDNIDEILDDIANNASGGGGGETGNFSIKATWDADTNTYSYAPLPKGLTYIDFVGAVVDLDNAAAYTVITAVTDNHPHIVVLVYHLENSPATVYYNDLNGKVGESLNDVLDDDSADDSGSGGGAVPGTR